MSVEGEPDATHLLMPAWGGIERLVQGDATGRSRGDERKERASLLRRDQMERAPHRPGLDQTALGERARHLAASRAPAPDPYGQLCRRSHLRLDSAESADDPRY